MKNKKEKQSGRKIHFRIEANELLMWAVSVLLLSVLAPVWLYNYIIPSPLAMLWFSSILCSIGILVIYPITVIFNNATIE